MEMSEKQLAIIKNAKIGVFEGTLGLAFSTYIEEHQAANQFIGWAELGELIRVLDLGDSRQLEGKICWVKVENGIITYLNGAKI